MLEIPIRRVVTPFHPLPRLRAEKPLVGTPRPCRDPRWPAVAAALQTLRDQRRHAVRIVDVDCGAGALLIHAARFARSVGFVAIDGLGIDGVPALVRRARIAAAAVVDPAIGLDFVVADQREALREEADCPADILLCGTADHVDAALLAAAAATVIHGRSAAQ